MSIADPRLLAIRDALVARLQGITKANGYHFDIGTIGTSFKQIGEITNFPAALVWTFLTRERKAERNSDSRSAILSAPIVGMTLYVKSGDPGTDALKFAQDVVAAIEAQPRDLDLVDSSVRYVTKCVLTGYGIQTFKTEESGDYAQSELDFSVEYLMARGSI